MVYCPTAPESYKGKPAIYQKMAEKTDMVYYHLSEDCLPPHRLMDGTAYVEEVVNRDSIYVEACFLPKAMHESIEIYRHDVQCALSGTLQLLRRVGHRAEDV
jgi:hypothetical protein